MAEFDGGEKGKLMDPNKSHITEITRRDLEEIAETVNMRSGDGIEISRRGEGIEISIDRSQFARWVKTIVNEGNI